MNKTTFFVFVLLMSVLSIVLPASALVDLTYQFNTNSVQALAFNCLDAGCNTVGQFSGTLLSGSNTNNGRLLVQFPSTLATPFGYALYFTSSGFLPWADFVTLHTFGNPGIIATTANIDLERANNCKSVIDQFTVTNDAQPNIPLVIDMVAGLDAVTRSAFVLSQNDVGFIPPQLIGEFYSADTTVRLQIFDNNGNLVQQSQQQLVLFADTTQPVQFSFTPRVAGRYTAIVSTEVTDNQCESNIPQSAEKEFNVLSQQPQNQCYTLLNNLALDRTPRVGQQVTASYNKISNHASQTGILTPTRTDVQYTVFDPFGNILNQNNILQANPDNFFSTSHEFSFTAQEEGMHNIQVRGSALDVRCNGLSNTEEVISLNVFVSNQPTFSVNFQIVDSTTGNSINGAEIIFNGLSGSTDNSGSTSFANTAPGTYDFFISANGFQTRVGSVTVINSNVDLFLTMDPDSSGDLHNAFFVLFDSVSGVPVPGATVIMNGQTASSNSDGLAIVQGLGDGTFDFVAFARGYTTETGQLTISGSDILQFVALNPVLNGQFRVTTFVQNADTDAPIANALVQVDGAQGTTSSDGFAMLGDFVSGVYGVRVSATGFVTHISTVQIIDLDVFLIIELEPIGEETNDTPDFEVTIASIRIPNAWDAFAGMPVEFILSFENNGDFSLENFKATVVSQELGLRMSIGNDDLSLGEKRTHRTLLELPLVTMPGNYPVRITLSSDKFKRVVYRDLQVLPA
ncbi:MAG: hypothetical protein Q7K43_02465 [Candidatus Woesearchaeota archaeon]|nr:hypothetical protein [Candidatus Woesearchaeota archaeon]